MVMIKIILQRRSEDKKMWISESEDKSFIGTYNTAKNIGLSKNFSSTL